MIFLCIIMYYYKLDSYGQSWRRGTKCTTKLTGGGFDPHSRKWNIYLNLYILFLSSGVAKARRWVPSLNMQFLQNSVENRERSFLTLCLVCCVPDTAWSWFIFLLPIIWWMFLFILHKKKIKTHYITFSRLR